MHLHPSVASGKLVLWTMLRRRTSLTGEPLAAPILRRVLRLRSLRVRRHRILEPCVTLRQSPQSARRYWTRPSPRTDGP